VTPLPLGHDACYSALTAHDARFDGRIYVGVATTGVFCRPVCRARTPKPENCRFFPSAAAAQQAGFRPCLRCRPELAPGLAPMDGPALTARRAARLIDSDPCGQTVETVAAEVGVTSRQLRRVFEREYGVTPIRYLQSARLLLAKNLLTDTDLPVTAVAYAAGFGSVRQFNDSFRRHYRLTPSTLRHDAAVLPRRDPQPTSTITLTLGYRPPYDWDGILAFLAARAIPGVERVSDGAYRRTVILCRAGADSDVAHRGWVEVRPFPAQAQVHVTVPTSLLPVLTQVLARLRHLFDLDCEPMAISDRLTSLDAIRPGLRVPGIRVPGAFDGFELAVRAILGQQISVKSARTLAARLAAAFGEPIDPNAGIGNATDALTTAMPTAAQIAALPSPVEAALGPLGIIGARARAIRELAEAVVQGQIDLTPTADAPKMMEQLESVRGIGHWTAEYVAMRALAWPDAFPQADLGIKTALGRALGLDGHPPPRQVRELAETWKPWRSYAALSLWRSLA
jgi:AraC family transcriptional regulator of adaptative response / DNA-3-methyladenine glycosylase II